MMTFSYDDYILFNEQNSYSLPNNFFQFIPLDRKKYNEMQELHEDTGISIGDSFRELSKRVSRTYFNKVYPTQSSVLNYSERTFPAYRFLLPEVLADDWLAIVDWHKKKCRDHALHQPLTAYITYQLLGGGNSNNSFPINRSNLLSLCVSKILDWEKTDYIRDYLINLGVEPSNELLQPNNTYTTLFWKSLFFETAMVSAIFHDIGYPWQFINRLNNSLSATDFSFNNSAGNADDIYHRFKNRLILYPFNGYKPINNCTPNLWDKKMVELVSKSLSNTHGFPGALGFLFLNDMVREYPTNMNLPFHHFCVEWAALGIMMHDMSKLYHGNQNDTPPDNKQIRLEFDRDPLSCIITLADILQEFERPSVEFINQIDSSKFMYNHSCHLSQITLNSGILTIEYKYNSREAAAVKRSFLQRENLDFFDPNYGYIDFTSIGINEIRMIATF